MATKTKNFSNRKAKEGNRTGTIGVEERLAGLSWKELADGLKPAARGAEEILQRDLKNYFGPEEFERLQQLAAFNRSVRARSETLGNVIFLHGITGSDLGIADNNRNTKNLWVSFWSLLRGGISNLMLSPDGRKDTLKNGHVVPTGVNKRYYARAVLALSRRWDVTPFAYDWRKDIDEAAHGLARLVRSSFQDKPVHLVAHSMGGLVCRNFIRLYPDLWTVMKDPGLVRGGRLIMLGTPNYGSFSIPQVLTGRDKMINLLATLDITHDLEELLRITNSFVGSYQMLPAPAKLSPDLQRLYRSETWSEKPGFVSQDHLDRAGRFHHDLETAPQTIDPERMRYIAGCRQTTLSGLKIAGYGDFDYELTDAGDGRVPHALGLLPEVPAFYVDEAHGDLARNESVITAVDELLESGRTAALSDKTLRAEARTAPTMRHYETAEDRQLLDDLRQLVHEISGDAAVRDAGAHSTMAGAAVRLIEDSILRAAAGGRNQPRPQVEANIKPPAARKPDRPIHITLLQGDISETEAPVIVVGHYKGVPPSNAVSAIDRKLDGWIDGGTQLGLIGGELGETFFVPNTGKELKAGSVILAGMGEFGHFTRDDLALLMSNVTIGVSALGLMEYASILIGCGEGNLKLTTALKAFLEGIAIGAERFENESGRNRDAARSIILVEKNPNSFAILEEQLQSMAGAKTAASGEPALTLTVQKGARKKIKPERRHKAATPEAGGEDEREVRITVEQIKEGTFRFSALASTAVVPVREVEINSAFAGGAAGRLMASSIREEQIQFGELLYTYLMPEDFHRIIDGGGTLKLILDRSTASYPWEMACFRSSQNPHRVSSLGMDLYVTRQFRTMLAGAPGIKPALNRNLKVLIIADPAREPEYQLPGARREGREVVRIFRNFPAKQHGIALAIEEHIGPDQCDPIEILALLLSGEFDIVHYAGHGTYDKDNPGGSGWIFGKDAILSAKDIFRARKVPQLVFANACFSAVTTSGQALSPEEQSKGLASIVQAFFERGVRNYIGSGWPVQDEQAAKLAHRFYTGLLAGDTIGDALKAGRADIYGYGNTWGAYQHYGDRNDRVLRQAGS